MIKYIQSTGVIQIYKRGTLAWFWSNLGTGYSGNGDSLNNPAKEDIKDHGPIPCGVWSIGLPFDDIGGKGLMCFRLMPLSYQGPRAGFLIHGDNKEMNKSASDGCIVMGPTIRQAIADSKIHYLIVESA